MEETNHFEKSIKVLYSLMWSVFGLIALLLLCLGMMVAILHAKGVC